MEKLKIYFKTYFEKSSKLKIGSDILFYLLILLLLIPTSRTMLIRATLFRPKIITESSGVTMKTEDYQLALEDLDGNSVNLSEYSNQTILISFWATWCAPCRAEMPSIQKMADRYGEKLPIFLITSEEKEKVSKFLQESGYHIPVYFQKSRSTGILDINSYPTTFLISSKGEIIIHKKGAANWNSKDLRRKLDELLGL